MIGLGTILNSAGIVAGDGLDFRPGLAQPGLERIGGVQQFGDRSLAGGGAAPAQQERRARGHGQQQQDESELHARFPGTAAKVCPDPGPGGKCLAGSRVWV